MLTMRMIGVNDYTVHEDGQLIGRIRYASERTPGKWLWNVTVTIPGPPFGDAKTLDQAGWRGPSPDTLSPTPLAHACA